MYYVSNNKKAFIHGIVENTNSFWSFGQYSVNKLDDQNYTIDMWWEIFIHCWKNRTKKDNNKECSRYVRIFKLRAFNEFPRKKQIRRGTVGIEKP